MTTQYLGAVKSYKQIKQKPPDVRGCGSGVTCWHGPVAKNSDSYAMEFSNDEALLYICRNLSLRNLGQTKSDKRQATKSLLHKKFIARCCVGRFSPLRGYAGLFCITFLALAIQLQNIAEKADVALWDIYS
jgi:hypothetical protein